MKEVIYNEKNIKDNQINRVIRRSKALIINTNGEILLANSFNNYQFPGGHVENGESFADGLIREVREETGIKIDFKLPLPFITIIYYKKDYPKKGINSKYIANYYNIKNKLIPKTEYMNLTSEEAIGNFKLEFINKNNILNILEKSLNNCTDKDTVLDTIEVIKEYLINESN